VQLVRAQDLRQAPGRPKTDKLDCVWQAKCTERGLLRPSVPPAEIRQLRDYARLRADLTRERTRYWQRLEKLLEDAQIKVSAVASRLTTLWARDMIEALIAGERDPQVLAGLARGRMRAKRAPPWPRRSPVPSMTITASLPGCCWTRSTALLHRSPGSPPGSSS
jgi:transposase